MSLPNMSQQVLAVGFIISPYENTNPRGCLYNQLNIDTNKEIQVLMPLGMRKHALG